MNKKILISTVLTVRNEEKKIADCLESVKWADEIIVVDDSSTDRSSQIARKFTDKVFQHKSVGYVEPVRNFAISKASGDWILILDADERIPVSLANKLQEIARLETKAEVVAIPRKNIIFGKWIVHTGWWPDHQIRFFRKGSLDWPTQIHQKPMVNGEILQLDAKEELSITHFHYETISEYILRMDRYTDIESAEYIKLKKDFVWTDMLTKPSNEFLSRFFARAGYRDGLHGLVLAMLQAISMLVVTLKIWEKRGFVEVDAKVLFKETEKEAKKMRKDLLFWFTSEKIAEIKNPIR
ncbi:MAG TPA: glycosyltransferase family 2 protein, partial [Candidatus Saccharimonadales bacterium]|nr:glycosyltransferase family 2 protein [Candidatus Saccharimonadales bacterium]HSX19422.1 glycosyltransferase family 2 protein [Candidatus Saccharimonadales bacterium]